MKISTPSYYKKFKCIADKCRHSCCIGWEIDVDEDTLGFYNSLDSELGDRIRRSIEGDTPHFALGEGERCPFLNTRGLCDIISELGEGGLCDICRLHPRFFNVTKRGVEVGLGASCEEAARIILSSDGYCDIVKIGEEVCEPLDFDALPLRDAVYAILSNRDKPYTERLYEIYKAFSVSPALLSDLEWRSVLSSLEYLDGEDKELFQCFSSDIISTEYDIVLERALAYFVYRHASSAENTEEFRIRIGFALVLERLLASCIKATNIPAAELLRTISEEIEYSEDNTERIINEIYFV
jgi:lysine-N-methylase